MTARLLLVLVVALTCCGNVFADPSPVTRVVMLGTGTPNPDPERSGPAVAIVVNDTPYLVDFGPGVVRRAAAMSPTWGGSIPGLEVHKLKHAFLTHLHSDHTAGLSDLILTPWVLERDEPLQLFGPDGIEEMASHVLKAYRADIDYRVYGLEPATTKAGGFTRTLSRKVSSLRTTMSRSKHFGCNTVVGRTPSAIASLHPTASS